jgi:hypothetical protein
MLNEDIDVGEDKGYGYIIRFMIEHNVWGTSIDYQERVNCRFKV